jgi:hypothetical protein
MGRKKDGWVKSSEKRAKSFKCGCDLRSGNGKYSKESIEQDLQ